MTTGRKILIDKYFGTPVVILLNLVARTFGFFLKRNHDLHNRPHHICISKFVGLGSIIQATPLIQTLKINFPDCTIIFLTSIGNKKLVKKIDGIDEALFIDEQSLFSTITSSLQTIFRFWKREYRSIYQ